MLLALASEGQGARDMGFDGFFLSAEFIRRKFGGRISRCAENFRQCRSTALQKTHPPVANRKSPVAVVLARQEPRTPMMSPIEVGAQFLRHQLRTKVRSMVAFGYGLKSVLDF